MKLFGEWTAGQITTGKWIYPNGMLYEGKFLNNQFQQKGKCEDNEGNVYEG